MTPRYLRNEPSRGDDVTAALFSGAVAVGAAAVAFYLTRLYLAREAVPRPSEREAPGHAPTQE